MIKPKILTILGTYRCTAECEHCCFGSNPRLTRRLPLVDILRMIDDAAALGSVELVVFSGGECFLLGRDLVAAVGHCHGLGLKVRCVTNGFWAKNLPAGRRRLLELRDAGLDELNISTGDAHQEWVPEQSVVNAARLGLELDLTTVIMVEVRSGRSVTSAKLRRDHPDFFAWASTQKRKLIVLESPWMPMSADAVIAQDGDSLLTRANLHTKRGCDGVFTTIVGTPDRKLGWCCGLSREKIDELNVPWPDDLPGELANAGSEFFKIWLAVDGPERILAWAASKNPAIAWEGRYAHHCHACLALFEREEVRTTLERHWQERKSDVLHRYALLSRQFEAVQPPMA